MMQIEQARDNMLKQQIRAGGVLKEEVLAIIAKTPREYFVPVAFSNLAYAEINIPLAHSQVMLTPHEEAHMLEALAIHKQERILEIGTGSGYFTALLAQLGQQVDSMEIFPDMLDQAKAKLAQLNLDNIHLFTGNGAQDCQVKQPYDVIAITGSLPFLPECYRQTLSIGGRLFAFLGTGLTMEATLITRHKTDVWSTEMRFETYLPPLLNAIHPSSFQF